MATVRQLVSIAAIVLGSAALPAAASAQDVRRGAAGWEAHVGGGCVVYYNWQGVRMGDTRPCNSAQRRIADGWVQGQLGAVGGPGDPGIGRPALGTREPIVRVYRDGSGMVDLRNGCITRYNILGSRIDSSLPCNREMRRYADDVYRERSYGGRGSGGSPGYGAPRAYWWGALVRVDIPGTDCSYVYTREGRHQQTIGSSCNSRLRDLANDAQRRFLGWR